MLLANNMVRRTIMPRKRLARQKLQYVNCCQRWILALPSTLLCNLYQDSLEKIFKNYETVPFLKSRWSSLFWSRNGWKHKTSAFVFSFLWQYYNRCVRYGTPLFSLCCQNRFPINFVSLTNYAPVFYRLNENLNLKVIYNDINSKIIYDRPYYQYQ